MDAVIEELCQMILDKVSEFGYMDQYTMLAELSRRIGEDAATSLKLEYMINETEFAEISDE